MNLKEYVSKNSGSYLKAFKNYIRNSYYVYNLKKNNQFSEVENWILHEYPRDFRKIVPLFKFVNKNISKAHKNLIKLQNSAKKINKTIFVYWGQGFVNAPEIVKFCLVNLKKQAFDFNVIELDNSNLFEYIILPNEIITKFNNGQISYPHYSDLIRITLLTKYGGVWMDATALATLNFSEKLNELYKYEFFAFHEDKYIMSNWFLVSPFANNYALELTKQMLYLYYINNEKYEVYYTFHYIFQFLCMLDAKVNEIWQRSPNIDFMETHKFWYFLDKEFSKKNLEQFLTTSFVQKTTFKLDKKYLKNNQFYINLISSEY